MQKHYTLTQAKKEVKELLEEEGYSFAKSFLKIQAVDDIGLDGKEYIDIYLNAYSNSDEMREGVCIESYSPNESEKALKRLRKLSETYEVLNSISI